MIRAPGTTTPGGVCRRFVSLQDVYPTLVELCALQPQSNPEGRSLAPLLKQPDAAWPSTAITAYGDRYISIRTEHFRYIRYRDEEFYECDKDPHEWRNQIDNPEFATAIREHRAAVPPLSEMA